MDPLAPPPPPPDGASPEGCSEAMVQVKDAYKSYGGQKHILKGFNMRVPLGSIYAFLGPSGCGKTTLLSCLVGRRELDAGVIRLGVSYKRQIGYMPQETALIKEISVRDTIHYFALLFGISEDDLAKRKKELYSFLEIEDENKLIKFLSGGQQRRASLCVALLHNPELLILDEPTVGLDPLLCHRIWEYLLQLSTSGKKTIILTTHYIEEARHAHMVGMMRDGVLLVEDSPKTLMLAYETDQLEDIFLKLSQKQESSNHSLKTPESGVRRFSRSASVYQDKLKSEVYFSTTRLYAHIIKNIFWLVRNKVILMFILLLPICQSVLYSLCIGNDPKGLSLGFVNDELTGTGVRAVDCSNFKFNCTDLQLTSCRFLDHLEGKKVNLIEYHDAETAYRAAKRGETWGFLHINRNYTESLMVRLELNLGTPPSALESSLVSVTLDMTNQYIGNFLKRDVYFAYIDFLEELYTDCEWPVKAARIPIGYQPAVYGSLYPNFSDFAVPAVLVMFVFYLPMMLVAGSILMEKREGLLERNFISGQTNLESFVGHAILSMSLLVVQTISMLVVIFVVFDHVMMGSLFLTSILCMGVGLCGLFFGFLVAVGCDSDVTATSIGLGSFFPLIMLSGMVWPSEGMHILLRVIGLLLPLTTTTDAFRSITSRGFGFTHPTVYIAFIVLFIWLMILMLATYICIRAQNFLKKLRG